MRRNGDRGKVGGDREILDRGYGFHRTGDRWLPDRWLGMPSQGPVIPPGFDPSTVPGMTGWWKADAITPVPDGTPVAVWPDSSPSKFNLSVFGQCLYFSNVLNGKPVIRSSPGMGGFNNPSAPTIPVGSPGYTVFVVCKPASQSTGSHTIFETGNGPAWTMIMRRDWNDFSLYHWNGVGWDSIVDTAGAVAGAWKLLSCGWTGTQVKMWKNGTLLGVAPASTLNNTGTDSTIMYATGTGDYWDGDMAEVLVYKRSLTDSEHHDVENYLIGKYGLTPFTIPGLKAWWAADRITAASLLREELKDRIKEMDKPTPQNG